LLIKEQSQREMVYGLFFRSISHNI